MSVTMIDYLPFDSVTYTQRLLPALHHATEGDEKPLRALIRPLEHISLGPRSLQPLPLSAEGTEQLLDGEPFSGLMRMEGLLDVATLRRIKAGEPLNPWQHLAKIIPFLKGRSLTQLGNFGEMLHHHLFYTLCAPPPVPSWTGNSPVLPHDEPVFDWMGYTSQDEETRTLWELFKQPAPEALSQYVGTSRALSLAPCYRESIIGLLTPEETDFFLEHVHTHARPRLETIRDGLLRDGAGQGWSIGSHLPISDPELFKRQAEADPTTWEYVLYRWIIEHHEGQNADFEIIIDYWAKAHPQEMQAFEERYYRDLWQVEEEVLNRMRQAVARGWGMIQTYYS